MLGRSESGYSLIEIMIALAILAIIGVFSVRFTKQAADGQTQMRARTNTQSNNGQLLDLISRDLRFRLSDTSITVSPDQKTLLITRRQAIDVSNLNLSDQTYQVRYQTQCISKPAQLAAYQSLPAQLSSPRLQSVGPCLKSIACASDQIPQVSITVTGGGRIPPYPNKLFPRNLAAGDSNQSSTLGSAACIVKTSDQIRITIDSIYAFGKDSYQVLTQDRSLSIASGDVEVLPHEL